MVQHVKEAFKCLLIASAIVVVVTAMLSVLLLLQGFLPDAVFSSSTSAQPAQVAVERAEEVAKPQQKTAPKTVVVEEKRWRGVLQFPVYAIGGETTGCVIETDNGDLELDLQSKKDLKKLAEVLNDKRVEVTGELYEKKGVERGLRKIIRVHTLMAEKN